MIFVLLFISILLGCIFSVKSIIKKKDFNVITITAIADMLLLIILFFTA